MALKAEISIVSWESGLLERQATVREAVCLVDQVVLRGARRHLSQAVDCLLLQSSQRYWTKISAEGVLTADNQSPDEADRKQYSLYRRNILLSVDVAGGLWIKSGMRVQLPDQRGSSITIIGALSIHHGLIHTEAFAGSNTIDTFFPFTQRLKEKGGRSSWWTTSPSITPRPSYFSSTITTLSQSICPRRAVRST